MSHIALHEGRGVLEIAGADRVAFLQGLVSNDVTLAAPGRAVWAALLTAQGRWLADFFVFADGDRLLLDCERAQVEILRTRLSRHKLRADVTLADRSGELSVYLAWDGVPPLPDAAVAAPDPRLPDAGWRILAASGVMTDAVFTSWDRHRLALGLPDGSRDMESERTLLLEAGFDELAGISWTKGCYMGQELTARTKYRGLLKRRLVPVTLAGPMPEPGTPVLRDGAEVGQLRSHAGDRAIAQLRLDALGAALTCGGAALTVAIPTWMRLPESAA